MIRFVQLSYLLPQTRSLPCVMHCIMLAFLKYKIKFYCSHPSVLKQQNIVFFYLLLTPLTILAQALLLTSGNCCFNWNFFQIDTCTIHTSVKSVGFDFWFWLASLCFSLWSMFLKMAEILFLLLKHITQFVYMPNVLCIFTKTRHQPWY